MAAREIRWIEAEHERRINMVAATWALRPGDVMLVTSKSKLADIIDWATRDDIPEGSPRLTHAEMVKMYDKEAGPQVASAEVNGLVNKPAARHFVPGRSGEVWRHFEFARLDVQSKLRDVLDVDQGETNYYSVIQAIFASDLAEKLFGWLPPVKSLKIYNARAKFCSRFVADTLKTLEDAFPGTRINPLIQSDGPAEKLSPRELWWALTRSEREKAGWRRIMAWDL